MTTITNVVLILWAASGGAAGAFAYDRDPHSKDKHEIVPYTLIGMLSGPAFWVYAGAMAICRELVLSDKVKELKGKLKELGDA